MESEPNAIRKPGQLTMMKKEIVGHAPPYVAIFILMGLGIYIIFNCLFNVSQNRDLCCVPGLMSTIVILDGILIEKTDRSGLGILIAIVGVTMLVIALFLALMEVSMLYLLIME